MKNLESYRILEQNKKFKVQKLLPYIDLEDVKFLGLFLYYKRVEKEKYQTLNKWGAAVCVRTVLDCPEFDKIKDAMDFIENIEPKYHYIKRIEGEEKLIP